MVELKDLFIKPEVDINETITNDNILGIILESGKIVSLNGPIYTKFSSKSLYNYPESFRVIDRTHAIIDKSGLDNTDYLSLYCYDSDLEILSELKENEYIPSAGELLDAFIELDRINDIREELGLKKIYRNQSRFWSSTIFHSCGICVVNPFTEIRWAFEYQENFVLPFIRRDTF